MLRYTLALAAVALPALLNATEVTSTTYRGWPKSWVLDNGKVRAVVVPEVGRVMQFGFTGEPGVFWENDAMAGKPMPEKPWDTAGSFGGDKTWPAPQSAWNWPPPDIFDANPLEGMPDGSGGVLMVSPVSPRWGIRTERRITLDKTRPVMRIVTTYHKVQGDPVEVAVWVITQMREPEKVFLPLSSSARYPGGLSKMWEWPSQSLLFGYKRVSITRAAAGGHKIGNDSDRILWVGDKSCMRVDIPRVRDANYPDDGCSAEIYTNGDPAKYVEIETLGPLKTLSAGDMLSATNTYTLYRRTRKTPEAEADALLR